MSYTEQAEKINLQFQDLKVLDEITKEKLINAILWFGQVAKFRVVVIQLMIISQEKFLKILQKSREKLKRVLILKF